MSADRLIDSIKGTTSFRLFLLLSTGVVLSQFVPPFTGFYPLVTVISLFAATVVLHLCRQYRLSILLFYIFLVAYGLLFASRSLVSPDNLAFVDCFSSRLRDSLISHFGDMGISEDNVPLLSALTLGERGSLSPEMVSDFRASGVAHVLVVSGMHVGFLYLLISFAVRRIPNRLISVVLGVSILWGYAFLVGLAVSVCRAVFMFSVLLVMKLVGESYRSFHALCMSAFVQLLISPQALFDVGFQLSYSAVLSILVFYPLFPYMRTRNNDAANKKAIIFRKVLSSLYNPIRLSVSAQILTAPLVAYYFGQFPLYFILTNLAVTLLVPVIFIGGFLLSVPYLGAMIACPLDFILSMLQGIVSTIASMPMALVQVRISPLTLMLVYLLIALVVAYSVSNDD